jgi:hypothetical protein
MSRDSDCEIDVWRNGSEITMRIALLAPDSAISNLTVMLAPAEARKVAGNLIADADAIESGTANASHEAQPPEAKP